MRFFFNTEDGRPYPDDQGTELPDLAAACVEGTRALGEFLKDKPEAFWEHDCLTLQVTDESGLELFRLNVGVVLGPAMNRRHPPIG